ncbi:hypothetical protein T4B_9601, partial [Trichinella pseudospiralis]
LVSFTICMEAPAMALEILIYQVCCIAITVSTENATNKPKAPRTGTTEPVQTNATRATTKPSPLKTLPTKLATAKTLKSFLERFFSFLTSTAASCNLSFPIALLKVFSKLFCSALSNSFHPTLSKLSVGCNSSNPTCFLDWSLICTITVSSHELSVFVPSEREPPWELL